jgi:hypothetical protein
MKRWLFGVAYGVAACGAVACGGKAVVHDDARSGTPSGSGSDTTSAGGSQDPGATVGDPVSDQQGVDGEEIQSPLVPAVEPPTIVIADEVVGTLEVSDVPALPTLGACGSGAEVELVVQGIASPGDTKFGFMPPKGGAPYVFLSRVIGDYASWEVLAVSKETCELEVVETGPSQGHGVAATADYLFWSRLDHYRWSIADGPISLAPQSSTVFDNGGPRAADAEFIYGVLDGVAPIELVRSKDGVDVEFVASVPPYAGKATVSVDDLGAVIGSRDYTLDRPAPSTLTYVDFASGEATRLPSGLDPEAATFGGSIYVCYSGSFDSTGTAWLPGGIVRVSAPWTQATKITEILDSSCHGRMAADAEGIYWLVHNGESDFGFLARANLDGSSPRALTLAYDFTVDETHIYWLSEAGELLRMAKETAAQ